MLAGIPKIFLIGMVVFLFLGFATMLFTVQRCGMEGLLLGPNGPIAAVTVCEGD